MSRIRGRIPAVLMIATMAVAVAATGALAKEKKNEHAKASERLEKAHEVYAELVKSPDRGVPESLLRDCKAIAIFPGVIKAAIGFGGRYGHGVVFTRGADGWSPPAFLTLTGGSWGLQIGANSTDVVLFFMTDRSLKSLLSSQLTLGADAGLAAGPMGRSAEAGTDIKLTAEIYSYARSRGLFAGIALAGARIAPDNDATEAFYGQKLEAKRILMDRDVPAGHATAYEKLQHALPS